MGPSATADRCQVAVLNQLDQLPVCLLAVQVQQVLHVARRDGPALLSCQLHDELRIAHFVYVGLADEVCPLTRADVDLAAEYVGSRW